MSVKNGATLITFTPDRKSRDLYLYLFPLCLKMQLNSIFWLLWVSGTSQNKINRTIFLGVKFCIDYSGYEPFYDVTFRKVRSLKFRGKVRSFANYHFRLKLTHQKWKFAKLRTLPRNFKLRTSYFVQCVLRG
eukprot:sb/3474959/